MALPALCALVAALFALSQPRTWSSATTFVPEQGGSETAPIAGIAAQFGISLPRSGQGQSPAFYAELLHSRDLRAALLADPYRVAVHGDTIEATLADLLEVNGSGEAARREFALIALRDRMGVSTGRETGIVRLVVTTPYADLSRQIAERALARVEAFNLTRRQTRAAAERSFAEERLEEERAALLAAEEAVESFQDRNRQFQNSPELTFEYERLQRRVAQRQQVYSALATAYEQARLEEVRQTPMISVVDQPVTPGRPNGRGTVSRFLLGAVIGLLLALLWIFARESLRHQRDDAESDYVELQRLKAEVVRELLLPIHRVRGIRT